MDSGTLCYSVLSKDVSHRARSPRNYFNSLNCLEVQIYRTEGVQARYDIPEAEVSKVFQFHEDESTW